MKYSDIVRFSFQNLTHKKLRSWLTILGIVIGVASFVALVSIGEGATSQITSRLGGLGADTITVSAGFSRAATDRGFEFGGGGSSATSKNITESDARIIKTTPGVLYVDGTVSERADMTYVGQTASVNVQGVDTSVWRYMMTTTLSSGRYLTTGDANVIVIGSNVATLFKQAVTLNSIVSIDGVSFKVVGVLAATQNIGPGGGGDSGVYMPIQTARQIFDLDSVKLSSISVKVSDATQIQTVAGDIEQRLLVTRRVTNSTKDFTVTTAAALQSQISSVSSTLTLFLAAISTISLLVGGIGISNTMFTSVIERTKQIGILKSLGMTDGEIMKVFLTESGLLGLIGGLVGAVIGVVASFGISELGLRLLGGGVSSIASINISIILFGVAFSFVIGALSGVFPARRAAKLQPVEALRYE
jgi:putative ABC transport system permease protein